MGFTPCATVGEAVIADATGDFRPMGPNDHLQPIGGWPEFRAVKPED